MATYKVIKENKYVTIHNEFFEIPTLSFGAKGLLGYIISKPADWKIQRTDLIKKSSGGKIQIEGYLLELMAHGFMNWYAVKNEEGKIEEWIYEVYEMPYMNPNKDECIKEGQRRIFNRKEKNKEKNAKKKPQSDNPIVDQKPQTGYPPMDNPPMDNPPFTKKDDTKKENTKKDIKELVNKEINKNNLMDMANSFYNEMAPSRYSKKAWNIVVNKLVEDLLSKEQIYVVNDPIGYVEGCLKIICRNNDRINGKIESPLDAMYSNLFGE